MKPGVAGKAGDGTSYRLFTITRSERREFTVAGGRTKVTSGKQCNEGDLTIIGDWNGGGGE